MTLKSFVNSLNKKWTIPWTYQNDIEGQFVLADSVHLDKIGMVQLFHYVHLFHEVLQIEFPWDINTNQLYKKIVNMQSSIHRATDGRKRTQSCKV